MEFIKWPKIPRLENEVFHISEKIDGTNACIAIDTTSGNLDVNAVRTLDFNATDLGIVNVYAQSRTRLINPKEDNYEFAAWVCKNAEQLVVDLGPGHHFGEWWGKGIQRGYGLEEKRFSLFNPKKKSSVCYNIPLIHSCTSKTLEKDIESILLTLKDGSFASAGYMKPEGLIVYGEQSHVYWKVIIDK